MNALKRLLGGIFHRFDEAKLERAHKHSIYHRAEIEASESCGCFFCLSIYQPKEIEDWTDWPNDTEESQENEKGTTAICPKCGIDSVLGSASGFPVNRAFLEAMRHRWFRGIPANRSDMRQ